MFTPTIGLEIHIEPKTKTKMFCSCLNDPKEIKPNVNICPVCLAHPGSLPVMNKVAIQAIAKLGLSLGGKIDNYSQFDRKSYFYPDLPKGYQISQYEHPIVKGGSLKDVRITRIHMEEDTGRLLHNETTNYQLLTTNYSLVDFNRAGVPLIELVTEPDVENAEQAVAFAKELQLILRYLEISDADMEKGQMRVEANISISDKHQETSNKKLGTKVEVKNLNSFKAVYGAIIYETKRQEEILVEGGKITQETRGWNDKTGKTESQRLKESAHDYRYFPEPDLPPLNMSAFNLEKIKTELPELPEAKRNRFKQEFKISEEQIEILVNDKTKAEYFEESATELKNQMPNTKYQMLVNYFVSDLQGLISESKTEIKDLKISPHEFAHFIFLIEKGTLSSRLAKDLLKKMFNTGDDPETLIAKENISVIQDEGALSAIVKKIIAENPQTVKDYQNGKITAIQFMVGKAMASTKGSANPQILSKLFKELL